MQSEYVASVSFGKDSLAMLLLLLETGAPLDEVVFYDTGVEFEAIYRNMEKARDILDERGIKFTRLTPENPFLFDMLERPVQSKQKGSHLGYGWCGGVCRWGTTWKTSALDRRTAGAKCHYIGIAADEPERVDRLKSPKVAPLSKAGMTEAQCLAFCRERGWDWKEYSPATESGTVDLYEILDRVSCWCCANKNRDELRNIYFYLPQYWRKLEDLQSQIDRPMKRFQNRQHGAYGDIRRMAEIFKEETKGWKA